MSESSNGQAAVLENGAEGDRTKLIHRGREVTELTAGEQTIVGPRHGTLGDKIQRYGWEVIDEPGEFMLIPKDKLLVDHSYQRDQINNGRSSGFAAKWSWAACGVLIVARRTVRGKTLYFIIDGQHRKLAADKRSDIKALPCLVFDAAGVEAEAGAFVGCNHHRGRMSSIALFKAQCREGDPNALAIKAMLDAHGLTIGNHNAARSLACIDAVRRSFDGGEASCRRVLGLCATLAAEVALPNCVFQGLYRLDRHMDVSGRGGLSGEPWAPLLLKAGLKKIVEAMDERAAQVKKRNPKSWADGVLMLILNKGKRSKVPSLYLEDAGGN